MLKKITLLVFTLTLLVSCNVDKDQSTIENYIQDSFGKEALSENQLYLFVPKDICPGYMEQVINYTNTLSSAEKDKITGVFIGNSVKELEMLTNNLNYKGNTLFDSKQKAFDNEIINPYHFTIFINRLGGESEILEIPNLNTELITNQIEKFLEEN